MGILGAQMKLQYITPEEAGISSKNILKFLKTLEKYHFCTHSFLMERSGKVFAEGYYAPFNKDFQHRMYSVSKSFVGIAVGLAVEEKLLSLDDKFIDFFPEYSHLKKEGTQMGKMTIRDMLKMNTCQESGIDWFHSKSGDRCKDYFQTDSERVPGTIYMYDSSGSFMLAAIVEKLTGRPFLEYLKEKILAEAGFSKEAYCLKCPGGHSFGDSGVMCTAQDLLIFARFVMDKGMINGKRYMNQEFFEEACMNQSDTETCGIETYGSYGYGYQIWMTRNNGFAFIGMGDQFAICDREKDFIFILNSDNQGSAPASRAILYHCLYEDIIDCLQKPMENDKKSYDELRHYISECKLFYLPYDKESSYAKELNGKKYVLENNPMGIEYVEFILNEKGGVLKYRNTQGEKKLPFGFGHNEFVKFPQMGYSDLVAGVPSEGNMYDCAVSADWPQEQKLRLKIQIIDKYFGQLSMIFSFKGDEISVYMQKTAEAFLDEYQGYACGRLLKRKDVGKKSTI